MNKGERYMNLTYAYISINILALAMIVFALFITLPRWNKRGGRALSLVLIFIFIGSFCIFMESIVKTFEMKLLWRNISQIGLFLLPASSYNFIMEYLEEKKKFFIRMKLINFTFAIICVFLIFTNDYHHIMRLSVELISTQAGDAIRVHQTLVGKICVAFNTLMNLTAMIKLWIFLRTTSKNTRGQVRMVLIGFLIPIIYTYTKSALLKAIGIEIPIPLSFLIGIIFILWGMYRYDLMEISPIARDWVIDEINIGMIFANLDGEVVDANRFIYENIGKDSTEIKDFLQDKLEWYDAILCHKNRELEIQISVPESRVFNVKIHSLVKRNRSIGTVSLLTDITKEKEQQQNLLSRAEKDGMTHLFNREAFIEKMNKIFEKAMNDNNESFGAFQIIDIDYFKNINDKHGHQMGDKIICEVANILQNCSRDSDLVGRLGGDEFMMFFPGCQEEDIRKIVVRIQDSVQALNHKRQFENVKVSLSIGIYVGKSKTYTFEELYEEADKALYEAKEKGRNQAQYRVG